MFDRFILASNLNRITRRFNYCTLPDNVDYTPTYNLPSNEKCYVITSYQTKEILQYEFGLRLQGFQTTIPFVRAEGDRNLYDDPNYIGAKAIFLKPEFKNLIRNQRCLILANAFVVGVEAMNPYLVYFRDNQRPFAFAGIWNKYMDESVEIYSFAIITVPANKLMQQIGYYRMPVILFPEYESRWLRNTSQLSEVLDILNPYPDKLMNAYPISTKIADKSLNDKSLILPAGKPIFKEPDYSPLKRVRKHKENHFPDTTIADWMKPPKKI